MYMHIYYDNNISMGKKQEVADLNQKFLLSSTGFAGWNGNPSNCGNHIPDFTSNKAASTIPSPPLNFFNQ